MSRRAKTWGAYPGVNTQTGGKCWTVPASAVREFYDSHGLTASHEHIRAWARLAYGTGYDVEIEAACPRQGIGYWAARQGFAVSCDACRLCVRQPLASEVARLLDCAVCGGAGAVARPAMREAV